MDVGPERSEGPGRAGVSMTASPAPAPSIPTMNGESSESGETVRVNFGKPMPLFPLAGVVLLPHAVLPLHIFEPRYRQMVEQALDGTGQLAIAVFEGERWKREYHGSPPIRPVVCVGQIIQHEKLADGRYNVLVQGVCRGRIKEELPPDGDRLYRQAMLDPVEAADADEEHLEASRRRLRRMLSESPLTSLSASENICQCLDREEAPTSAVLELVGVSLISDDQVRYQLLEEGDPGARAEIIEREMASLRSLLSRAELQRDENAPKGVSWN